MVVERDILKAKKFNRKTLRVYFYALLDYLDLPRIPLYVRDEDTSSTEEAWGIFDLNKNKEPFIVIWRGGWNKVVVHHEVIHYVQYLVHGEEFLSVKHIPDPYELEAESLERLPRARLKKYIESCLIIRDLQKGQLDV